LLPFFVGRLDLENVPFVEVGCSPGETALPTALPLASWFASVPLYTPEGRALRARRLDQLNGQESNGQPGSVGFIGMSVNGCRGVACVFTQEALLLLDMEEDEEDDDEAEVAVESCDGDAGGSDGEMEP
jgi:hypothetical protein